MKNTDPIKQIVMNSSDQEGEVVPAYYQNEFQ